MRLRDVVAAAMRANQFGLHRWVSTFTYHVKNNGELDAIHQTWLHEPLPTMPAF